LKRIALAAIPTLAVIAGIAIYVWRQKTDEEATARIAEVTGKVASTVVDQFGEQVNKILSLRDDGAITVDAAQQLFGIDEKFVKSLPGDESIPDVVGARSRVTLILSDVYVHQQNFAKALSYAEDGEKLAERAMLLEPGNPKWLNLDYGAASRVGDVMPSRKVKLDEYRKAQARADAAVALAPHDGDFLLDQGLAHRKIGDMMTDLSSRVGEYNKSMEIIATLANQPAPKARWLGELASTKQRLGQDYLRGDKLDQAEPLLRSALDIREKLVAESPRSEVYNSNLTSSYTDLAKLYEKHGDWPGAIGECENAVDRQKQLVERDSDNLMLENYLAQDYANLAQLLERYVKTLTDDDPAWLQARVQERDAYLQELAHRKRLAEHDLKNLARQKVLGPMADKITEITGILAAYYSKRGQRDEALINYRLAIDAWDKVRKIQPDCSDCVVRTAEISAKIGDALLMRQ
jgi:tetratricopeptide (TPR) repeat protein